MIAREIFPEACSEPGHGAPCINQGPTKRQDEAMATTEVVGKGALKRACWGAPIPIGR